MTNTDHIVNDVTKAAPIRMLLTLKSANVLTQYVASSTVSSSVTWMRPYVSVALVGQYWSHFTCSGETRSITHGIDRNGHALAYCWKPITPETFLLFNKYKM